MDRPVVVGAVLYDPKVSVIWETMREFFEASRRPIDTIFYTNYQLQVDALVRGQIDIAWNSPLAWLDSQRRSRGSCRAIAMRDTDRDRVSHIVVLRDGPRTLEELRGKTIAFGAKDSPQATLIPIGLLYRHGLVPGRDFQVRRSDLLLGKHGDHIGGELEAFKRLASGEADACAMLDLNWNTWTADGTIDPAGYVVLATTDLFDHCVFTTRSDFPREAEKRWLDVLFSMSYEDPRHRRMMEMEGLKRWLPGRTTGFGALSEAVERQGFFEDESA